MKTFWIFKINIFWFVISKSIKNGLSLAAWYHTPGTTANRLWAGNIFHWAAYIWYMLIDTSFHIEDTWKHVYVHWQQGQFKILATCSICWMAVQTYKNTFPTTVSTNQYNPKQEWVCYLWNDGVAKIRMIWDELLLKYFTLRGKINSENIAHKHLQFCCQTKRTRTEQITPKSIHIAGFTCLTHHNISILIYIYNITSPWYTLLIYVQRPMASVNKSNHNLTLLFPKELACEGS